MQRNPQEIAEIERHKYFLSEKAGHDVGWDFAEKDWEENFAQRFRRSRRARSAAEQGASEAAPAAKTATTNQATEATRVERGGVKIKKIIGRVFSTSSS